MSPSRRSRRSPHRDLAEAEVNLPRQAPPRRENPATEVVAQMPAPRHAMERGMGRWREMGRWRRCPNPPPPPSPPVACAPPVVATVRDCGGRRYEEAAETPRRIERGRDRIRL
nr:unnamed protein product [Digitaria exilis]